ncbi:hypothetical protein MNSC_04290 [Minisyncoccus archaeophilus]
MLKVIIKDILTNNTLFENNNNLNIRTTALYPDKFLMS